MWIWPGITLLACCQNEKKSLRNGVVYTVESWSDEHVIVSPTSVGGEISLTFEQVKMWLRLSYAQTYASCQGSEFNGSLRLHCTDSPRFTRKHLFVGLSRAKEASLVSVV